MFYKKNIELLGIKNKILADEISKMFFVFAEENIEPYPTESGDEIFACKGLLLEDIIDPKATSLAIYEENIPKDFNENDIIVVFGLGAGFLLKTVMSKTKSKVVLVEPKIDILRYSIEFVDYSTEFSKDNLFIAKNTDEAFSLVKNMFASKSQGLRIVYPDAYIQLLPEELDSLQTKLTELVSEA